MPYQLTVQRNLTVYNVKDFGAVGDGVHDDTAAIQSAINAAAGGVTNGTNTVGGEIFFPGGTYLNTGLILYSYIHLRGAGITTTNIRLKNGSNTDVIQGYNAPALIGGSSSGGIANWSIQDLSIDANKTNQSGTSYAIRFYGLGFILQNLRVHHALNDCLRADWNGGSIVGGLDSMEAEVINCKFHDAGNIGVNWTGPHDTQFTNVFTYQTNSHAFYIGPNATGMLFVSCHGYGMTQGTGAVTWLVEATGAQFSNCVAEGSDSVNLVILANKFSWSGGSIFCYNTGTPLYSVSGVQIGQVASSTLKSAATSSPITLTNPPTNISLLGTFLQFVITGAGASGSIAIVGTDYVGNALSETVSATGNGTFTSVNAYFATSSIAVTGLTGYSINVVGLGKPFSNSSNQSGGTATAVSPFAYILDSIYSLCEGPNGIVWFANDGGNGFIRGPVSLVDNANANKVLFGSVNTTTYVELIPNGATPDGTTGKGGWLHYGLASNKAFTLNDTVNDIINMNTSGKKLELVNGTALIEYSDNYSTTGAQVKNGTIGYGASASATAITNGSTITTSGVGIARVNPAGNVTSIVLQVGTFAGQKVSVINTSAFTVTFDTTPGNSNIASSAADGAIPAKNGRTFEWLVVEGFWFRVDA